MKIVARTGNEDIAVVYVAETNDGRQIEFVESLQPPIPRQDKWVLIISTLYGCPIGCRFCDAGNHYGGKLSKDEMLEQIDFLVGKRFPWNVGDGSSGSGSSGGETGDCGGNGTKPHVPVKKFKIQFARMGEPAFNGNVLDVLSELPGRYDAPGLMPSLSTIAPRGADVFFERLLDIKSEHYNGSFQLQFSIHTTDGKMRDWLMPVKKWDLGKIAEYGERFFREGDRKITLNFALVDGMPVDPGVLLQHFTPEKFLIKITPVNPTYRASENKLSSHVLPEREDYGIIDALRQAGYRVILSIGELEENHIGSNCGQHVMNYLSERDARGGEVSVRNGYTYSLQES